MKQLAAQRQVRVERDALEGGEGLGPVGERAGGGLIIPELAARLCVRVLCMI
jgi:hypothetical protein